DVVAMSRSTSTLRLVCRRSAEISCGRRAHSQPSCLAADRGTRLLEVACQFRNRRKALQPQVTCETIHISGAIVPPSCKWQLIRVQVGGLLRFEQSWYSFHAYSRSDLHRKLVRPLPPFRCL